MRPVRRFPWAGVFLLLLMAAFLFLNMGWLNMHADEELSYESTPDDVIASIQYQIDLKDNQAPGWFVLFRLWRTATGDSELAGRVLGILTAQLLARYVSRLAPVGVAGATAMDTCLPVISRFSGEQFVVVAVFSGMLLSLWVPFVVAFLLSL